MATSKKDKDEVIVDVEEVYSKSEEFIEKNKKPLTAAAIAIIVIVGAYYGYKKLYMEPLEEEAISMSFRAVQYFESDSTDKAIYGDNQYPGFIEIIDEFGGTKTANLAHYYLGISYLKQGKFEDAIDELKSFDADDEMVSSIALGAIGDAYIELNEIEDGISYYKKAARNKENEFVSPIYLMKAGKAMESIKDYAGAVDIYQELKEKFPESQEGRQVEKYLARAESFVN